MDIVLIACGTESVLFIRRDGKIYCDTLRDSKREFEVKEEDANDTNRCSEFRDAIRKAFAYFKR